MPFTMRGFGAALVFAACVSTAQAQTKPAVTTLGPNFPKTEMFIGNSFFYYNNGMPSHVSSLAKADDPDHKGDYAAAMVTIGGSNLQWHDVESYFRRTRSAVFSFIRTTISS